jgi:hypothetical protein
MKNPFRNQEVPIMEDAPYILAFCIALVLAAVGLHSVIMD